MTNAFGFDDLGVEVVLPMRWSVSEEASTGLAGLDRDTRNLRLLQLLEMEEGQASPGEVEAPASQELARLEARLDLLIHLVGQMLPSQEFPDCRLWLGVSGLGWFEPLAPGVTVGERIRCQLLLTPAIPLPLYLVLKVALVQEEPDGWRMAGVYEDAPGTERDALQRLVFRLHRREIARQRKARAASPSMP